MWQIPPIILSLLVILIQHQVSPFVNTIGDVATVSNFANDALAFVNGELPLENFIMGSTGQALNIITDKLDDLSNKLNDMEANNERRMNYILETLINRIPQDIKVDSGLSKLHYIISRVDKLFETYEYYVNDLKSYHRSTIEKFIDVITSNAKGDLEDTLDMMHLLMMPGRSANYKKPLLEIVNNRNKMLSFGELCGAGTSPQQRLFEIYHTVINTEVRGFIMTIFSYAMFTAYKNVSFAGEIRMASSKLVTRAQGYLKATQRAMSDASIIVEYCDPENFTRGENFIELEKSIQMFVVDEADIGNRHSGRTPCWDDCSNIESGGLRSDAQHCNYDNGNKWCPYQSCYGRIYDCTSGGEMKVCDLQKNSLRRYDFVIDSDGHNYGNTDSCNGRIKNPVDYVTSLQLCDICICTCADEIGISPANRTINLRPQLSNIKANMVITGVKFISSDKIIHIQIKEGELISGGRIKPNTERWVEPEHFRYDPTAANYGRRIGSFYLIAGDQTKFMKQGKDFAFINYYQRTVNLDDVKAPLDYVVTGVKFMHELNDTDGRSRLPLQLAIYITKFDFSNGILVKDSSYWICQENMPSRPPNFGRNSRKEVVLSAPDDPSKGLNNQEISGPWKKIRFTSSDREKDAGQTTIPLFDGQPVISTMSSALSGIGLVHRGGAGSGGFLALRLLTLDLSKYLKTQLTPEMIGGLGPGAH